MSPPAGKGKAKKSAKLVKDATAAKPAAGTRTAKAASIAKATKTSGKKAVGAAKITPEAAQITLGRLAKIHPDAHCELDHRTPFELLVATVLSAQTTDVAVNKVTPALFAKYPDAQALAAADPVRDVEPILSTLGMFRQKSRNIVSLAKALVAKHRGEVPRTLAELVELSGVGRKTANVVLGVAFNAPEGVVVDTHVQRISQRLGWTKNTEPEKIEKDLCSLLPQNEWDLTSHVLIFHGRRICFARKPSCDTCGVNDVCPSAGNAENVGRKPPRARV